MAWTLYHNPRCSKSRDSLTLLQQHDIDPVIVPYLDNPPDLATLRHLLQQLALPARALLRDTEAEYHTLQLANPALDDTQVLTAIVNHPRLLQRPIISNGQRAVIGRPPENLLALLPADASVNRR